MPNYEPMFLLGPGLFTYRSKLRCLSLSITTSLDHYLWARLGAYPHSGVLKGSPLQKQTVIKTLAFCNKKSDTVVNVFSAGCIFKSVLAKVLKIILIS